MIDAQALAPFGSLISAAVSAACAGLAWHLARSAGRDLRDADDAAQAARDAAQEAKADATMAGRRARLTELLALKAGEAAQVAIDEAMRAKAIVAHKARPRPTTPRAEDGERMASDFVPHRPPMPARAPSPPMPSDSALRAAARGVPDPAMPPMPERVVDVVPDSGWRRRADDEVPTVPDELRGTR